MSSAPLVSRCRNIVEGHRAEGHTGSDDATTQRDECKSAPKHEPTTIEEASVSELPASSKSNAYLASKWLAYMLAAIALFATIGTRIVKLPNPRWGDACVER